MQIETIGNATLYHGDCLDVLPLLPDLSVDMVAVDLPYGTTACAWDSVIPLAPLWGLLARVVKDHRALVFTASQPFSSILVSSNFGMYSHQWIWQKNKIGNALLANTAPLKNFEDVLVFIKNDQTGDTVRAVFQGLADKYGRDYIIELFEKEGRYTSKQSARVHAAFKFGWANSKRFDVIDRKMFDYLSQYINFGFEYADLNRHDFRNTAARKRIYNPQGVQPVSSCKIVGKKPRHIGERPNQEGKPYVQTRTNYPRAIIDFDCENGAHPTQKPVALFEYMLKTYTNAGMTVLDNCMGSGTTGIACIRSGRKFVGIEKDAGHFATACKRIEQELSQGQLAL